MDNNTTNNITDHTTTNNITVDNTINNKNDANIVDNTNNNIILSSNTKTNDNNDNENKTNYNNENKTNDNNDKEKTNDNTDKEKANDKENKTNDKEKANDKENKTNDNKYNNRYLLVQKYLISNNVKATGESFENAVKFFFSRGIKCSFDKEPDNRRIIFSFLSGKYKNIDGYSQECNGLILDANTWKILVYPPNTLSHNIDTELCNKLLVQGFYNIYKVEDGTCFNLYYYKNKWVISTSKGYEMNLVMWNKQYNYQDIITEILKKYNHTWESFCNKLNKNNSYSFGFKHPEFHPFWEGRKDPIIKLWFIQSVNLNLGDKYYLWANDKKSPIDIPLQEICVERVYNLKSLYRKSYEAYNDYLKNKKCLYGYILRSNNPTETGLNSNLLIESSLMRTLRKSWYDNKIVKFCINNKYERKKIIPLFAYLDNTSKETFLKLFPIYKHLYSIFNNKTYVLVDNIFNKHNNINVQSDKIITDKIITDKSNNDNKPCENNTDKIIKTNDNTDKSNNDNKPCENKSNNDNKPCENKNKADVYKQKKEKKKSYKDILSNHKNDQVNNQNIRTENKNEELAEIKYIENEYNLKISNNDLLINNTSMYFYELTKNTITISPNSELKKLIYEFIIDIKFINILYEYMYN
jgi:hypothetical protein